MMLQDNVRAEASAVTGNVMETQGDLLQCLFKSSAVFRGLPSHWLLVWFLLRYGTLVVSKKGIVGVDSFDNHGTW